MRKGNMRKNTMGRGNMAEREDIIAYQSHFCDLMTEDIQRARIRLEMILSGLREPDYWHPTDEQAEHAMANFNLFMVQMKYFSKGCEELRQLLAEKMKKAENS